ncbi:nicotinamide-nucleotide amidase [Acidihalobacter prosperus]
MMFLEGNVVASEADLARSLGDLLKARGLRLTTAESCTGGWIAKTLTDVPGSSAWFERGFVTYSNDAKHDMLGVPEELIARYGAVSGECVAAMAEGALRAGRGDVAVAVSGIAGPDGGSAEKPVGTVWFGFSGVGGDTETLHRLLPGDRESVRRAAVNIALQGVIERLSGG